MNYSYDRILGSPEKKTQSGLVKLASSIDRKLTYKVLGFLSRL